MASLLFLHFVLPCPHLLKLLSTSISFETYEKIAMSKLLNAFTQRVEITCEVYIVTDFFAMTSKYTQFAVYGSPLPSLSSHSHIIIHL